MQANNDKYLKIAQTNQKLDKYQIISFTASHLTVNTLDHTESNIQLHW